MPLCLQSICSVVDFKSSVDENDQLQVLYIKAIRNGGEIAPFDVT